MDSDQEALRLAAQPFLAALGTADLTRYYQRNRVPSPGRPPTAQQKREWRKPNKESLAFAAAVRKARKERGLTFVQFLELCRPVSKRRLLALERGTLRVNGETAQIVRAVLEMEDRG